MRTCSAVCSKRHKEQTSCTGTVDPTRFLKRSELLADVHTLNRDYNFLQRVDRQIHVAANELEDKMPKARKRGAGMTQHTGNKRRNAGGETIIVRSGVNIHQLPSGMWRASNNRTGWMGKKNKFFGWTIEWVLWDGQEEVRKTSHGISESTILADAAGKAMDKEGPLKFYLQKVPAPANKPRLISLDGAKSVHDNLEGKSVIEYPTIHVVLGEPQEKYLLDSDDSDSDSDSSSSSSSSEESSDESDDEPPEENSSKEVNKPEVVKEHKEQSTEETLPEISDDSKELNAAEGEDAHSVLEGSSSNTVEPVHKPTSPEQTEIASQSNTAVGGLGLVNDYDSSEDEMAPEPETGGQGVSSTG